MVSAKDVYDAAKDGDLALQDVLSNTENYIDVKSRDNDTALHFAAMNGHLQAAQVLISNMANVHEENQNGETPLHKAVKGGNVQIIQLLIANGANVDEKYNDGETSLILLPCKLHNCSFQTMHMLMKRLIGDKPRYFKLPFVDMCKLHNC